MSVENIKITGFNPEAQKINADWFGAIQTGFHSSDGFDHSVSELGISLIRWPGGTLSETRPDVYGLDIPGLFDATDLWQHNPNMNRPDLSDTMAYAAQNDMTLSVIIPTARYVDNIGLGEAQLRAFLADLTGGSYGELPPNLILELGNEYAYVDAFRDDAAAYGTIASSFTRIISEFSQNV